MVSRPYAVSDVHGNALPAITPAAGTGQNLTIGAASVESAAFTATCVMVRLSTDAGCHYRISATGGEAVDTDAYLAAGDREWVPINPGVDYVQVIRHAAESGTLNVIEARQ